MDNLASSFLKYGDEVLLYSEQMTGFLYSDGWFDSTLYLPKVDKDNLLNENHDLTNFIFKISPKCSYDAIKQFEKIASPPSQPEGDREDNEQYKKEMDEYIKNKIIIEKRCSQEVAYNSRVKKNKYGEFVLYGSELELIHKASGKVITIMNKSSVEVNKTGAVVLELRETGRPDKCNFKILPRYKYRSEGEKIIYGDFFVLFNETSKNFFFISPNIIGKSEVKDDPPDYRPTVKFRRPPSSSMFSKFLIEMRQKNNSRFQLIPFKHANPDSYKFIKGGDIVKIKHTEIGGYLCIDGTLESKQNGPICFVRKYRGNDYNEEKNSSCLFEVETHCRDEHGRFIKWRDGDSLRDNENVDLLGLNSKNLATDEELSYNFKLRHLNSGRYLSIKQGNSKEKFMLCLGSNSDKDILNNTLFTLESQSVDPDDRLKSSIVVKIKNVATNSYISTSTSLDRSSLRKTEAMTTDLDLAMQDNVSKVKGPFKLNEKSIQDSDVLKIPLVASIVSKDEDAFIIETINNDYARDCFRIHAAVPYLKEYITDLKKKREDIFKNKERMKFIESILTELIFFAIQTEDKDPLTCEGEPNKDRQKLIRELKLIEVLCDMLYYPFVNNFISLEVLVDYPNLSQVCGLINRLLKHVVQDYRLNEEYVAQWIELFFNQLMNTSEGSDDNSESTITAILGNNKKILDSQISRGDIVNIVNLCKSRKKNQRFINLINCLLVCQGEAVVSNQNYVVEIVMMEDESTKQFFVIPIRENNGGYEIFFSEIDTETQDQWIDLRNIKSWSEKNDELRLYNYYLSYLDLVSLCCFDRSYKGINAFEPIFPFEITFGCAKDESLPYEIRSRFTDILLTCHVDKQPLEPLRVPSLTRVWDAFESHDADMPFKENIPKNLLDLKPFVKKFLVENKGLQKSFEKAKNKMMLSVLNLAKCLVTFGFYKNQDEFIEMIDPLITILDGSHDVSTPEEEDIMQRLGAPENFDENMNIDDVPPELSFTKDTSRFESIIIKCKDKMSEILGIVMDIQNDIRISNFLREFNTNIAQGIEVSSINLKSKRKSMRKSSVRRSGKIESGTSKALQLFEKQMDNKKLDLEVLSWSDYVCINLYLMLYKDEDLIQKAGDLLVRFHSQRKSLFDLLRSVQMLENSDAIETLAIADKKLAELREMAQNSEFWLGQSDRESIKTSKKTIDILNYLSNLMIENNTMNDFEDSGDFDLNQDTPFLEVKPSIKLVKEKSNKDKSRGNLIQEVSGNIDQILQDFMNEKIDYERSLPLDTEIPNQEYQRMLRNLEAHEIIMLIIKENSLKSTENEELYKRVIKTAYSTLIRFVRNNKVNKKLMVKYVESVFSQHHGSGLGSSQLEGEILKDDQSLLQKGYSDFKERIDIINNIPLSSYSKASHMYYLTIFLKFKEEPIPESQIAIATELVDKDNQNIIFLYEKDETRKELTSIIKNFTDVIQRQMSSNSTEISIEIPPSLSYSTQLLTVMAVATQGKNSITEIMCQSLFPVAAIIKCFKEAKFAYTYKIALMQFFLDAYLDIEKDVSTELQDTIPEILNMLNEELLLRTKRTSDIGIFNFYIGKEVVENEIFKKGPSIFIISLLGRYRMSILHEIFVYNTILSCLERIFQLRLVIDKKNESSFAEIISSIQKVQEITKDKDDKKDIAFLIDVVKRNPQLRLVLAKVNNEDEKQIEENDAKDLANSSMNRSMSSIHKHGESKQRVESRMIEGSGSNAINKTFLKNKDSVGLKLASILNDIGEIENFTDSIVNEFSEVIKAIKIIKRKSFLGFMGACTLEPTDVIEALVDLTDLDGIQVTLEQIPIVIKILRRIIEIENKLTIKPAAEWSGDEDNPTPEIIRAQDLLTSCNACYLAANLVRNQKGDAVTNEAILFSIALLIGGNYNTQMKFWEDFVEDTENRFLTLLSEILKTHFNKVMDHSAAYNEISKQIQTLERSKEMEMGMNQEENENEELNELISLRDKLDARTQPDPDEDEDFTSIAYSKTLCIRILRFFQLLCENHNINLQNHLREQSDKDGVSLGLNFDFPTYFSTMLGVFTKDANVDIMDLGGQIIDTLVELIQGPCRGNQKALISAKIIDNSRDFIAEYQEVGMEFEMKSRGFDLENDEHLDMINETKQKLVTLLLSLLEGPADPDIISRMSVSLDFLMLKDRMYQVYRSFIIDLKELDDPSDANIVNYSIGSINSDLKLDSLEGLVLEGFDIYILFQSLAANSKVTRAHLEDSEFTQAQKAAYDFFKFHTGRIEVNVNDELERVYFPIRPVCKYMTSQRKLDFILSANRESPSEKARSLMESARTIILEMKHEASIENSKFMISPKTVRRIRDLSLLIALTINILQLIYLKLDQNNYYITKTIDSKVDKSITILNYILIGFSSLTIVLYVISEAPLILNRRWNDLTTYMKQIYDKDDKASYEELDRLHEELETGPISQSWMLLTNPKYFEEDGKKVFGNWFIRLIYYLISLSFIATDGFFIYYLFFLIISVIGQVWDQIYLSFLLLDFVMRFKTLGNVIQSVTRNKFALILTGILILIIIFIYTSFGFFFFRSILYNNNINASDDTTAGESMCDTMISCYFNIISYGLRNGGGIGDVALPENFHNSKSYHTKLLYTATFQIVIIIIMLNIVFGIIIDTFAELRDEKKSIFEDQEDKCFICNMEKYVFYEGTGEGFEPHIANDHNMWNYIYYLIHLETKDPTEFTGVESYVKDKYEKEDITWFPLHKAMVIDNPEEGEGDDEEEKMIQEKLDSLAERLQAINQKIKMSKNETK